MVNHGDVSRRENLVSQCLEEINRKLLRVLARKLGKMSLVLDVDATAIKTGKRTATITYKDYRGRQFTAANVFVELRAFVASEFRNGNEPSSKDVMPYSERCRANMPERTHISTVSAEAAYYQSDVLKWCIDNGSNFAIRAIRDTEVMRVIAD